MSQQLPWSEIEKHADISSCWVVLHGKVYDLTAFVGEVSEHSLQRRHCPAFSAAAAAALSIQEVQIFYWMSLVGMI